MRAAREPVVEAPAGFGRGVRAGDAARRKAKLGRLAAKLVADV